MKGAMLCGFLLDELVAVAKMLKENPEMMSVKDAYLDGYKKGYEDANKELTEYLEQFNGKKNGFQCEDFCMASESDEELKKRLVKAINAKNRDCYPFISTDGGLDLEGTPKAENKGGEDDGVF